MLSNEEKLKKYDEMVEKRKSYSKKHYYKNKSLIEKYKELLKQQQITTHKTK